MEIPSSVFSARYKLACFFIANHLFETVIAVDPGIDLSSLTALQRDSGFFMSSLRIVEQLCAFTSESELETLKTKIEASGTMYFKKSILTAVVKQGTAYHQDDDTDPNKKPVKKPIENLFDKFVVKRLYDSYFSAYVDDTEPLEFLDKVDPRQQTQDLVSIYELGVFDTPTLQTISEILDFSDSTGALAVAKTLSENSRYSTYKHFFGLVSKCL
ncbi:MAG: hypothetical protein JHC33_13280 [Ignisphaera sp.]|nr:hypothetical protein [Ignisphaera sp.]